MLKTKVFYILDEETDIQYLYLSTGDLLDMRLRCSSVSQALSKVKVGWLHHKDPIVPQEGHLYVYRNTDKNPESNDWYTYEMQASEEKQHQPGFLFVKEQRKTEFPILSCLHEGTKGLYALAALNEEKYGSREFYAYPDKSCGPLIPGPCEITGVKYLNPDKRYAFVECRNAKFEVPDEAALAEYFRSDEGRGLYWENGAVELSIIKNTKFGDFACVNEGCKNALLFAKSGDSLCCVHDVDATNPGGEVVERIPVLEFMLDGYFGVSLNEIRAKFKPFSKGYSIRFHSQQTNPAENTSDLLLDLCEDNLIRFMEFNGVRYATFELYNSTYGINKLFNYTLEELDKAAEEFNNINEAAVAQVRSLVKNGKIPVSMLSGF